MTKTIRAAVLAALIALLAGACQPTVAPLPWTAPAVADSSPEGTLVAGDSITWQADMAGYLQHDGAEYHAYMGWRIDDVTARIRARRDSGTLTTLVLALGTNDSDPAWNGGWAHDDEVKWLDVVNQLHEGTRVSIVLPWVDPAAQSQHALEVAEARAYLTTLADVFGATLVDWAPIAQQEGVLDVDGVHLAYAGDPAWDVTPTAGAARAYAIALARGVDQASPVDDAPASIDTPAELEAAP